MGFDSENAWVILKLLRTSEFGFEFEEIQWRLNIEETKLTYLLKALSQEGKVAKVNNVFKAV